MAKYQFIKDYTVSGISDAKVPEAKTSKVFKKGDIVDGTVEWHNSE